MARLSILNKLLSIEGTKYGLKKNLKKSLYLVSKCVY